MAPGKRQHINAVGNENAEEQRSGNLWTPALKN